MNFNRLVNRFILGLWVSTVLVFSLFSQGKESSSRKIEGLEDSDILFILEQLVVPQYEEREYDGPKIDITRAYKEKVYTKESILSQQEKLKKRVELAINYREKGDIDQFSSILKDIITRNNFNEEAAWAALLLGDFELVLYNLEEALNYYVYVVNVHYNSGYGLGGIYKLAITLDKKANWDKAEKLLLSMLTYTKGDNLIKEEALKYLQSSYLAKARWYYEQGNDEKVKEFYFKYKDLTKDNIKNDENEGEDT